MNVGMLWFDGDVRCDIPARIARAAEYYRTKYGQRPTLCFVNPAMAGKELPAEIEGLLVRTSASVLRDHLWLGVDDGEACAPQKRG